MNQEIMWRRPIFGHGSATTVRTKPGLLEYRFHFFYWDRAMFSWMMNDNLMSLSSLYSKKKIHWRNAFFFGKLIPLVSKLVPGIYKFWFDDPYLCILYQFIISSTNPLIPTVYWLLISGCLLWRDVVPYFWKEGYRSIPVLSFFYLQWSTR